MNQIEMQSGGAQGVMPGGFWVRVVGVIVDGCISGVVALIPNVALTMLAASAGPESSLAVSLQILNMVIGLAIGFFYYGWFYQNKGATPGKMIFGLRVVDTETGGNIGYGKTFLRQYVGAFLCVLTLGIGYLMVAFRSDKRGLHDMVAGTRVIRVSR
jgi:uncharacterized RDD family membrane protein YckC